MRLDGQRVHYGGGLSMPAHADGCRRLSVVVAGYQEESARGRSSGRASCGSVVLKDANLVHSDRFGSTGTTIVSVLLPDDALEALGVRPADLVDWQWMHDGPATFLALRLAIGLREGDGALVECCLLELLDAFSTTRIAADPAPIRLQHIRDQLHDEPWIQPSLRRLAETAGLHPVSLGRAFRRQYGCTITQYRQRLRAAAVARALLDSNRTLVDIALDQGFADSSHMTRLVRRELGLPPRGLRNRMREAPPCGPSRSNWSVFI